MGTVIAYCLRSRWFSALCCVVVVLSFVLPPAGFGAPGCQFKAMTHLPCLGCGLTRSFIGVAHLDLGRAWHYHPVGIPLFLMAGLFAVLLPFGARVRERFAGWAERSQRPLNYAAIGVLAVFTLYGVGRMALCAALLQAGQPAPW
jgi:hypothetical protein